MHILKRLETMILRTLQSREGGVNLRLRKANLEQLFSQFSNNRLSLVENFADDLAGRTHRRDEADALSCPHRHRVNITFGVGTGRKRLIPYDLSIHDDNPIASPSPGRLPVGGRPAASQVSMVLFLNARWGASRQPMSETDHRGRLYRCSLAKGARDIVRELMPLHLQESVFRSRRRQRRAPKPRPSRDRPRCLRRQLPVSARLHLRLRVSAASLQPFRGHGRPPPSPGRPRHRRHIPLHVWQQLPRQPDENGCTASLCTWDQR